MNFQEKCEEFAIQRATKMNYTNASETLIGQISQRVKNRPAIAERAGMFLVGDYSRAELNLKKLDEMLAEVVSK
jgi:hypothetical protein